MKYIILRYIAAGCFFTLMVGCHKESPVQLVDDLQSEGLEIENSPAGNEPLDSTLNDSTGVFVANEHTYSADMIVEGLQYDAPGIHHESSIARARFFDHSDPIILDDDTLSYWTLDAGIVTIDNLSLRMTTKRFSTTGLSIDSVGVQYSLANTDGVGGRGFQYFGNHQYLWNVAGSSVISPVQLSMSAPAKLHVTFPTSSDSISLSKDFVANWTGGGSVVRIIISDIRTVASPRELLNLRVGINQGKVTIPARILHLLPADRARFLFTFTSRIESVLQPQGFQGDIHLQAETTHDLVLNVIH